ncbi:unnamed protein product [Acanthoscelides obtectus]|uniref:RING-type domain-containing protein n=1 Tax=Acanthoscelides obtectus TaxID=200917 RepID=A0A9P0M0J8_ACAOB|nr:unnamed protein product [Acanthoscelides obtectus]CAK1664665.1 Polycomb group RING finger protein 2 [Acanthoscelides obtectus]
MRQTMANCSRNRILVKDLNSVITCRLCDGYLIDATTLVDCFHVFCRACILRHFENNKTACPIPMCNTSYKKKSQPCFRPDPQIQSLVYKLVPSLYARELQRREDFYRSTGVRASSSCSDDSVIERERQDLINDHEEMISNYVGDKTQFFSPEDSISLSLEYYQVHLDTADVKDKKGRECSVASHSDQQKQSATANSDCTDGDSVNKKLTDSDSVQNQDCDKRYLQCPAAVSMKHLQKFIRMKFGLTVDHKVDIIYEGEVLPQDFSLMDVAYTFKWKRLKPMRFFYRIFFPMKIRPIKIVNTTLSTGGKQLQIVPVKPNMESPRTPKPVEKKETKEETPIYEQTQDQKNDKELLFAHLQLQSKVQFDKKVPEKPAANKDTCVFEYEEPDLEEIKKFAEKRDREWAMQKKLDEKKKEVDEEYPTHHSSKKRKKSKHSKNEFNVHKKRKLHAEIASNEEELKLKVKITNNGYKHKHHKSSGQSERSQQPASGEMSSKEKLLQMRQVRHKHLSIEDKNFQTVPSIKITKAVSTGTDKIKTTVTGRMPSPEKPRVPEKVQIKPTEEIKKLKIKVAEPTSKVSESAAMPKQQTEHTNTSPKVGTFLEGNSSKLSGEEWGKKPTVKLERNDATDKEAQKTFLKTFHAYAEKYQKIEKQKVEKPKTINSTLNKLQQFKTENKINTSDKSFERKIVNLQQQCIIEPKVEKKVSFVNEKRNIITTHYPPGFTVSKVEQGIKRKGGDPDSLHDKRPSLEITLINPPSSSNSSKPHSDKPVAKRPPPDTIPLERIKKSSINLKSGISIIPKRPDMCDNNGALDLSKSKTPETSQKVSAKLEYSVPNGISITPNPSKQMSPLPKSSANPEKNMALSNLQMLSKVATEHSTLTKSSSPIINTIVNKPRPQIPNLQTLKHTSSQMKPATLQKLPKLNEIQKFRPTNPQIRNVRPNQNQNIRNIPNPSLLIRLQNQRMHSQMNNTVSQESSTTKSVSSSTPCSTSVSTTVSQKDTITTSAINSKILEMKEISV